MMSAFDLSGGSFLQLYGALFVLTFILGLVIPRWLRAEGGSPRDVDAEQLAYLAGGKMRFVDTVVSRLMATRALSMSGKKQFRIEERDAGRTAAERSVLALSEPASWASVERAVAAHASDLDRRLVSSGLLIDRGAGLQIRFFQTLPYLLLFGFGAIKWNVGVARDKPVGFLTALLIATAVFALIRFAAIDRRTRGGVEALSTARAGSGRLRRAHTATETDVAVALFGTTVLIGSTGADYHQMRSTSSGSDSGSGGSDGGGGGCGGGGCGGCGGS